jgi:hypothetical protein
VLSGSDLKCGFDLHVQHKTTASNEIIAHSNDINVVVLIRFFLFFLINSILN